MILFKDLLFCGQNAWAPLVVAAFDLLQPDKLAHLPPKSNGRTNESLFVRIDHRPLPDQVKFVRFNKLGLLQNLPENEERWNEELHGVVRKEARDGPGQVGGVAIVAGGGEHPDSAEVRTVWLEPANVGEFLAIEALCLAAAVEADVGQ